MKTPRTEPIADGCEKLAPFLITDLKQAISVWVELEKIRMVAAPSKSGMTNAISGIPATSDAETGIVAPPVIGTSPFIGHRLYLSIRILSEDNFVFWKPYEPTYQNWHRMG